MSIIATLASSKISENYTKDGYHNTPQQEKIDPKIKQTAEYCADISKTAFSSILRDRSALPTNYYSKIQILRDYLTGSQRQDYYINMLGTLDPESIADQSPLSSGELYGKQYKMDGYEHLSTKIVSSMPAIRQAIQGWFSDYDEFAFV